MRGRGHRLQSGEAAFHRVVPLLMALVLLGAACAETGGSEGIAANTGGDPCSKPAETDHISFMGDWLPWALQGPFFAAQENGYYEQEGLTVDILAPANPADPIKLVSQGRVDVAISYVPETLQANEEGVPIVAVATLIRDIGSGLMVLPDSGITSPADLEGKILGVGPKTDLQAYLGTLLSSAGLTKDDVRIVDPGFAHIPALLEGKLDAAEGLSYAELVILNGILEDEGKPPAGFLKYADYGTPNFYWTLIVSSRAWLAENPSAMCRFLRATARGLQIWAATPDQTLNEIVAKNDAWNFDQEKAIWSAMQDSWTDETGRIFVQDESVWQEAQRWALANGLIQETVDPSVYFSNDYLPKDLPTI